MPESGFQLVKKQQSELQRLGRQRNENSREREEINQELSILGLEQNEDIESLRKQNSDFLARGKEIEVAAQDLEQKIEDKKAENNSMLGRERDNLEILNNNIRFLQNHNQKIIDISEAVRRRERDYQSVVIYKDNNNNNNNIEVAGDTDVDPGYWNEFRNFKDFNTSLDFFDHNNAIEEHEYIELGLQDAKKLRKANEKEIQRIQLEIQDIEQNQQNRNAEIDQLTEALEHTKNQMRECSQNFNDAKIGEKIDLLQKRREKDSHINEIDSKIAETKEWLNNPDNSPELIDIDREINMIARQNKVLQARKNLEDLRNPPVDNTAAITAANKARDEAKARSEKQIAAAEKNAANLHERADKIKAAADEKSTSAVKWAVAGVISLFILSFLPGFIGLGLLAYAAYKGMGAHAESTKANALEQKAGRLDDKLINGAYDYREPIRLSGHEAARPAINPGQFGQVVPGGAANNRNLPANGRPMVLAQ